MLMIKEMAIANVSYCVNKNGTRFRSRNFTGSSTKDMAIVSTWMTCQVLQLSMVKSNTGVQCHWVTKKRILREKLQQTTLEGSRISISSTIWTLRYGFMRQLHLRYTMSSMRMQRRFQWSLQDKSSQWIYLKVLYVLLVLKSLQGVYQRDWHVRVSHTQSNMRSVEVSMLVLENQLISATHLPSSIQMLFGPQDWIII